MKPRTVATQYVVMCCAYAHPSNHFFECEPDSIWLSKNDAQRYLDEDEDIQTWKKENPEGGFFIDDLDVLIYD